MKKSVLSAAVLAVLGLCGAHALNGDDRGRSSAAPVAASAAPLVMSEGIRGVPEGAAEAMPLPSASIADTSVAPAGEPPMSLVALVSSGGAGSDASLPRMVSAPAAPQRGSAAESPMAEVPDLGDGLLALAGGPGFSDGGSGAFAPGGAGFGQPNLAPTGSMCQTFGGGSCDLSNVPAGELRVGEGGGKSVRFGADEFAVSGAITAPIPEPSTYALMFVGLVVIGGAVRRRCNNQE